MGRWSGGFKRPIADDGGSKYPVLQDADVKNSTEFVSSKLIFFFCPFLFLFSELRHCPVYDLHDRERENSQFRAMQAWPGS